MTYLTAKNLLNGRSSKRLAQNTYIHPIQNGIGLKYYDTEIMVFHPDESIFVDCKGFRTKTTKERLNENFPPDIQIYIRKGAWFWQDGEEYKDGCTIKENGTRVRPYKKA